MAMLIYGDSRSGHCLKVRWPAARLGLPFQWREVDVLSGFTRTPEFLQVNPAGQVPSVVLDDGRPLAQSNAILLYLAEGSSLIPTDPYQRARMLEWLFWEQYNHEPTIAVARFQMKFLGKSRAELEPKLIARGNEALARLELGLASAPYLVDGHLSLADISLVAYTRWAHEGGFDLEPHPGIRRWIRRLEDELRITD
jgi:glutathione S-transferase